MKPETVIKRNYDWRFPVNIQFVNIFFHFYFFVLERQAAIGDVL